MIIQFYDGNKILKYNSKNGSTKILDSVEVADDKQLSVLYVKDVKEFKNSKYDSQFGEIIKSTPDYIIREHIVISNIDALAGVDVENDVNSMLSEALEVTNFRNLKKPPITAVKELIRKELMKIGREYDKETARWSNKEIFRKEGLIDELQKAFFGGGFYVDYNLANTLHSDSFILDIKSDYPFLMLSRKFPVGKWYHLTKNGLNYIKKTEGICFLFKIEIKNFKSKHNYKFLTKRMIREFDRITEIELPIFANENLIECDRIVLNVTDVDYELIKQIYSYSELNILDAWYAETDYLPKYFTDFIQRLYIDKETLPKGSAKQKRAKKLLNSIFGNCAYRGSTTQESHYPYSYAWAVWTASYGRELQFYLNNNIKSSYYSAIDSVFCDKFDSKFVEEFNKNVIEISDKLGIKPVNGNYMGTIEVEEAKNVVVKGTNNYMKNGETFVSGLVKKNMHVEEFITSNFRYRSFEIDFGD